MAATAELEYSQELRALREEIQATIARLGGDALPASPVALQSPVRARVQIASGAHGTPATTVSTTPSANDVADELRSEYAAGLPVVSESDRSATAGDLLRELALAADRRRLVEHQVHDARRNSQAVSDEELRQTGQQRRRRRRRRHGVGALHRAIEQLQQQRAEIVRQIECETIADRDATRDGTGAHQTQQIDFAMSVFGVRDEGGDEQDVVALPQSRGGDATVESQYSIGGIVTLEPVRAGSAEEASAAIRHIGRFQQHAAQNSSLQQRLAQPAIPGFMYPKSLDTLNDVFSIQLKFAETMLKLEKSVQARDQLLQDRPPINKRRPRTVSRKQKPFSRRESKQALSERSDQDDSSDSELDSSSGEDDIVDSSLSSIDTEQIQRLRSRRRSHRLQSADSAGTGVSSSVGGTTATASTSTHTSPSAHEAQDAGGATLGASKFVHDPTAANGQAVAVAATRSTPSTGDSKKSEASSSKQVHFGNGDCPTPLIARKFSFGSQSDDDHEDDHDGADEGDDHDDAPNDDQDEEYDDFADEMSVLSLLEGSSVHSSELNDVSFLRAFKEFRVGLKAEYLVQPPTVKPPPTARALFSTPGEFTTPVKETSRGNDDATILEHQHDDSVSVETIPNTTEILTVEVGVNSTNDAPDASSKSEAELLEHRRQLCLDIQAESAKLVLAFRAPCSDPTQVDSVKRSLLTLREELRGIDDSLAALQQQSKPAEP